MSESAASSFEVIYRVYQCRCPVASTPRSSRLVLSFGSHKPSSSSNGRNDESHKYNVKERHGVLSKSVVDVEDG